MYCKHLSECTFPERKMSAVSAKCTQMTITTVNLRK